MAGVRFQYYTPKIEMPKINTFNMVSKLGETAVNALDRWNLNSAIQKTFGDQGAEKPQSPPAVQNAMSMLTAPTPEQPPSPVEKAKRLLIDGPNPQNTPQSFAENKTDSLITGGPQGQTPQTIARPGETPPQAMSRLIAEHGQGENTGPGEQTLETIRKFEGYSDKPYWDVNAHRTGYGSDTVTLADNSVQRVRPGMKITREDAERDLTRRVGDFQSGIVKKIGQDNWMNMPENGKAALTSVAYNYGSLPDSVAKAAMTPGLEDDAAAIANLQGHNGGVNRNRRLQEAKLMLGTGGVGGDPDVPVAGGAQAGFTIPRQAGMPPAYPGSTQPPIDTRALAQILSNPQASPALQQAFISRAGGGKPQENWQFVNTNQGMGRFNQVTGQLEMMPATGVPQPSNLEMLKGKNGQPIGFYDKTAGRVLSPEEAQSRGISAVPQNGVNSNENFDDEHKLRTEFDGLTKSFRDVDAAYNRIQSSAANPSAAGDLALIFNYMKMLDPGSVVREGEFATAQNAAGVPERIVAQYNRTLNGERLTEGMRADFLGQAGAIHQGQVRQFNTTVDQFRGLASRYGYNPENIARQREDYKDKQNIQPPTASMSDGSAIGQQQPVRVMSPQDARRYPSGTPIQMPDGTIGRVP